MTVAEAAANHGAQFYLPGVDTPERITMFYRWVTTINHCGEANTRLCYLTHTNAWHCSSVKNATKLVEDRLVAIPGVPVYDPVKAEAELRTKERMDWGEEEYMRITQLREKNCHATQ